MPGDLEDHEGDREPDQRVGDLEADRDDDRAGDDAEADESVGAGVVAVGDERGAVQAAAPGALSREFGSGVRQRSAMHPRAVISGLAAVDSVCEDWDPCSARLARIEED